MKHVGFLLLIAMVISLWLFPSVMPVLSITLLLVSLGAAILFIIKKQREAYLEVKITRTIFVRNISLEILGVLLAMIFAGLLGRTIAQVVTAQITIELARIVVGIMIGLLAGIAIGILVKKTWGRRFLFYPPRFAMTTLIPDATCSFSPTTPTPSSP